MATVTTCDFCGKKAVGKLTAYSNYGVPVADCLMFPSGIDNDICVHCAKRVEDFLKEIKNNPERITK